MPFKQYNTHGILVKNGQAFHGNDTRYRDLKDWDKEINMYMKVAIIHHLNVAHQWKHRSYTVSSVIESLTFIYSPVPQF